MRVEKDIVYGSDSGRGLRLDLYAAEVPASGTAVIMLHGGAWRRGSKEALAPQAKALADLGFVCLPAEYRLRGEAEFPAMIHDVKAAIRWARANAESLGVQPDRIVVQGFSAGAHLALLAAGTPGQFEGQGGNPGVSSEVDAVVAWYPAVEFGVRTPGETLTDVSPHTSVLPEESSADDIRRVSPISYVSANFPPTLLCHGINDTLVTVGHSRRMFERLTAAGVKADLQLYSGYGHGFGYQAAAIPTLQAQVAFFLNRTLVEPDRYRHEAAESPARAGAGTAATAATA